MGVRHPFLPPRRMDRAFGPKTLLRQSFPNFTGATTTTLTPTAGAVTFTGSSVGLTTSLSIGAGAVTFTGSAVNLRYTLNVGAPAAVGLGVTDPPNLTRFKTAAATTGGVISWIPVVSATGDHAHRGATHDRGEPLHERRL